MNLDEAKLKFIEIKVDCICLFRITNPFYGYGVSPIPGMCKSYIMLQGIMSQHELRLQSMRNIRYTDATFP